MMKKISIFGVITLLMALFIWSMNINALAATYEDGYSPLNENTTYVDEIKLNNIKNYFDCNSTTYATTSLWSDRYNYITITRTRVVYGDTEDNVITTIYRPYAAGMMTFMLKYNDEVRIRVSAIKSNNILNLSVNEGINFNDPTRKEFQSCSKVKLGAPTTTIDYYGGDVPFDINNYPNYEDLALTKFYDVTNVINLTKKVSEIPTIEKMKSLPITLENGLKIDSTNNFIYGGNYVLDNNNYIPEGNYTLKVATKYGANYYAVVYKILIVPEIDKFPGFETNPKRQVSEKEIKEQIESFGITDYSFDADNYYDFYNIAGRYIINVTYKVRGKEYTVMLPIDVKNFGDEKIKLIDDTILNVSYSKELDYEKFEQNIDFGYIELDNYTVDYSNYIGYKNKLGSYLIHVKAVDKNNKTYIASYSITVIDDISPEASLDTDFNNVFSYTEDISILDILSYIKVKDLSECVVNYDENIEISIGKFTIDFRISDIYGNYIDIPVEINIIDDIAPKIIANDINAISSMKLEENAIKSQIFAIDEISGKLSADNITINDINGYKNNYDVSGTYRFEVIAKDESGNEGHGFFNIIVKDDSEGIASTDEKVISIDKDVKLSKDDIINYLNDNGLIDDNSDYEISSDYFDSDTIDKDSYNLEIKSDDGVKNYEIKIKESDVSYEMNNKLEEKNESNNLWLIITLSIIGVLLISSGVLVFIIYKKRH